MCKTGAARTFPGIHRKPDVVGGGHHRLAADDDLGVAF